MNAIALMALVLAGWNYHWKRIHRGLENRLLESEFGSAVEGKVNCRERLGGLLRYDYRNAA